MTSPYYFDKAMARAAVEFFPRWLRFTGGEWAGRPFELSPHHEKHIANIFGWRRRDGTRRYRRVRGWEPKKNGKTEVLAGIGHILTIGDAEPGAAVFSHARDKAQASIVFNAARRMVELDQVRRGNLSVAGPLARLYEGSTKTALFCSSLMSSFQPLSGDPEGKHGPSVHGALGDEAHEWRDGTMHSFLQKGMVARRQPLDLVFSTAGVSGTYGEELYADTKAIIANPDADPECYAWVCEAEPEDDWTDPAVWAKANPNLGITVKADAIASLCKEAQRRPAFTNDFLRYHLNRWVGQETRWLPMHRWRNNTAHPDDESHWKRLPELMRGWPAFCGIDLASVHDITAILFWFEPCDETERTTLVPFFFVPESAIAENDSPATPYRRWHEQGALIATPGEVTDYDFIERCVMDNAEPYRLARQLGEKEFTTGIDRWNATQVTVNLRNEGLPIALVGQGFASLAAPTKEIERRFFAGGFEHGNHPVLKWMFGNANVVRDAAGNMKPTKENAKQKIDGVVAACIAGALAIASGIEQGGTLDDYLASLRGASAAA